jgi:hypothetical protein
MTAPAAATSACTAGAVTRYWKTGLVIGNVDLTGIYLASVRAGLVVQETRCDMGMQDNFALRAETTVDLAPVKS